MGRAQGEDTQPLVRRRRGITALRQLAADFPRIDWDLDEIAPLAASKVNKQFRRLAWRYPLALEQLAYVGTVNGDPEQPYGSGCWAQSFSDRLELNPFYFADLPLLTRELAEAEHDQWHPDGCDSVESIVTHEFAHVLYRRLKDEKAHALSDGVEVGGFGTVAGTLEAWLGSHDPRDVSIYARHNREEAFAEAFSSLHHTPARRQCDYVRSLATLLETLLETLLDQSRWQRSRGLGLHSGVARSRAESRLNELAAALGVDRAV